MSDREPREICPHCGADADAGPVTCPECGDWVNEWRLWDD